MTDDQRPPVDTIAVPREVLQGVREALKDTVGYVGDKYYDEYNQSLSDRCKQALASLDAVLSEGK